MFTDGPALLSAPEAANGAPGPLQLPKQPPPPQPSSRMMGDGNYFLQVLADTVAQLEALSAEYDPTTVALPDGSPLHEEHEGKMRAAIGKAKLLITKRLPQFRGLCELNLDPNAEKKATNEDLAGFWDLISLAIEDVLNMFRELAQLRDAGWPAPEPTPKPSPKLARAAGGSSPAEKKAAKSKKAGPSAEIKKAMAAKRKAMKEAMMKKKQEMEQAGGQDAEIAIFVPGSQQ